MELKELLVPLYLFVDAVQDLLGAAGGLGDEVPLVPVLRLDTLLLYLGEQQRVLDQPLVLHWQDGLQLQRRPFGFCSSLASRTSSRGSAFRISFSS